MLFLLPVLASREKPPLVLDYSHQKPSDAFSIQISIFADL